MIKQWWRKWKCVYDQNFRRRCESVLRPWTKHDTETKLFQSWFISKNCVGNMHQSCRNPNISYGKSPQHIPVDCLFSSPRINTQFQIFQIHETWRSRNDQIELNTLDSYLSRGAASTRELICRMIPLIEAQSEIFIEYRMFECKWYVVVLNTLYPMLVLCNLVSVTLEI